MGAWGNGGWGGTGGSLSKPLPLPLLGSTGSNFISLLDMRQTVTHEIKGNHTGGWGCSRKGCHQLPAWDGLSSTSLQRCFSQMLQGSFRQALNNR